MRILVTALVCVAALLALGACADDETPGAPDLDEETPVTDDTDAATITGTLAGDAQLEGGCVWVESDDGRYEVVWPDGWQADVEPVELRGPDDEVVAREGDAVRITGAPAQDVATICQVGTVFEAETVEAG